jgi:hypothetical protein
MFSLDMLTAETVSLVPEPADPLAEMRRQEDAEIARRRQRKPKARATQKKIPRDTNTSGDVATVPDQKLKADSEVLQALTGSDVPSERLQTRYRKMVNSRGMAQMPRRLAGDTPPDAESVLALTPLDRQTEEQEIGDMLLTDNAIGEMRLRKTREQDASIAASQMGDKFDPRAALPTPAPVLHPITSVKQGQTGSAVLQRRRRKKKQRKLTEEEARAKYASEEVDEVNRGRQTETSVQRSSRMTQIDTFASPDRAAHKRRDEIDPTDLPQTSLDKYKARDSAEAWMLAGLKEINRREDAIVHQQPPPMINHKFMAAMRDNLPFYDALVKYHVVTNKPIPVPATYTWEYCETLLREAIPERGERPCRLAASGSCESVTQFGFACRERMHEAEYRKFVNLRMSNPQMAHTALPPVQRLCLCCYLCHVTNEYFRRLHKRHHKDDATEMPDGTSETYDDTEPICDMQMDVTKEGQYDIFMCVGVGDKEYLGMPGAVVAWDPSNYLPSEIMLESVTAADKKIVEQAERRKRANQERRKRAGNEEYDPGAWLRATKPKGYQEVHAVFRTPAQTPVPGHFQSQLPPPPDAAANRAQRRKRIRTLKQRDCLRFRDGVMPVRVETERSSPSTRTSCE